MSLDQQRELQKAHSLLDRLPPEKLGVVRSLLEVMLDDDAEESVIDEDRRRVQEGRAWFAQRGGKMLGSNRPQERFDVAAQ
jgi:hypothetical protein